MADQSKTHLGDHSPDIPDSLGFAPLVRHIALVGVAGLATGFVVAGGGGRLLMRVAAIAGPDSATGRLTESGFNVGEIPIFLIDTFMGFAMSDLAYSHCCR